MLTSPLAANKFQNWPTLGRPTKEQPMFAKPDSKIQFWSTNTGSENGKILSASIEHSDEDSVDFAIDDLETTYARPEFNESFGLAIAEALNKAAHSKNPRKQQQPQQIESTFGRLQNGGASKKKKNTKKTILFSTGNRTFDGK